MDIELTVRAGHVSDRIRDYAKEKIGKVQSRFDRVGAVRITLDSHKEEEKQVHVHAKLESGAVLVAEAAAQDLRGAIDEVSDNLVRQVQKQKERLIERNRKGEAKSQDLPPDTGSTEDDEPSYEDVIREDLER